MTLASMVHVFQESVMMAGVVGMYVVVPATECKLKERLMEIYTDLLKRSVDLRNNSGMEISVAAAEP
jgi:hypothetical protein